LLFSGWKLISRKDATESIQEVAERPVTVGEVEPVAAEKTPGRLYINF
jgi:hypothetical protein